MNNTSSEPTNRLNPGACPFCSPSTLACGWRGHKRVVGRFTQAAGVSYQRKAMQAVEVRQEPCDVSYHRDKNHDHWYVYLLYAGREVREDYPYDHASGANEFAAAHAIANILVWDRAEFPRGLVRE